MTRTEALRDLVDAGLGAAAPDPSFDRFARLVSRQLGVPMAAVVLLLEDAQVFPGAVGLPADLQRSRQVALDRSLSRFVVEGGEPVVIGDTRRDPRSHEELPGGRVVHAYAGYPVRDLRGRAVGALCAFDAVPRRWTPDELECLADLAAASSAELAVRAERERARRIQHVAVRANRKSRALLMLSEAFADATSVADVEETLSRVSTAGLGARWSGLALVEPDGRSLTWASSTFLPPGEAHGTLVTDLAVDTPPTRAVRTGAPCSFHDSAALAQEFPGATLDLGAGSRIVLPLLSGRRVVGAASIVWESVHEPDDDSRSVELALARYTAQALDRVRLLEDRREVAKTLQAAMLTDLPTVTGLELASTYSPAGLADQVGGDWYDAVVLDDDAAVLMIGDVTGHDMRAAALMGQLRSMLRTFAWSHDESPATLMRLLDRANAGLGLDATGTAVVARLDRRTAPGEEGYDLTWSSAGHVAPLVLRADGRSEQLDGRPDFMLGVAPGSARVDHVAVLAPGDTLVLCTDGLVERRDAVTGIDMEALTDALTDYGDGPTGALPTTLVRQLVGPHQHDDVAVLAVRARHSVPGRSATNAHPVSRRRDVAPGRASAGRARRWVDDLLESVGVTPLVRRDAMLLTSELVTNALHHGAPPVALTLHVDDERVRVAIDDGSPLDPVVRDPRPDEGGGRGMQLVARFSSSWGVDHGPASDRPTGAAKSVWFELDREHAARGVPLPR